jgi:3-deoxy-D-manno-octulosonic-acid transferase
MPLLRLLRKQKPEISLFLSVGTVAGRQAAFAQAESLVDGIFYVPIDFASIVRRTLRSVRPSVVVIFETEIWPCLYSEVKRAGAGLMVVNGRISDRTWPRYERWGWFFGPILRLADCVGTQSDNDHNRYGQLGVLQARLFQPGNLKYDAVPTMSDRLEIITSGADPIWAAASTAGPEERENESLPGIDEDDAVLDTWSQLATEFPGQLLILAPRQPARFDAVAAKLERRGIPFVRRSQQRLNPKLATPVPGVLLVDTIGELARLYPSARVVFVGGSLAPRGGHNILEPAATGAAIVVGPHMQNFAAIAADFVKEGALVQIGGTADLSGVVRELFRSPGKAQEIGSRAQRRAAAGRGATERIAERIWPLYHRCDYKPATRPLRNLQLNALAALWVAGGRLKRVRGEAIAQAQASLPVPVLSVGGITIGGSGKTPFAAYLAKQLHAGGFHPAILTRGYRKRTPAEHLVFAPGTNVPVALTGDEAQIFLRAGHAAIGVGARRYETAQLLLEQLPETNVLILDDGFQHARLCRDFDIVMIDGMDPFGGEAVVPKGRLREPLASLHRAHTFVVTRAEDNHVFDAVSERLRLYNPAAPVFRTKVEVRQWRDYRTRAALAHSPKDSVAAFCALGNPANFWRTLEQLDVPVGMRWSFRDHHAYKPVEIQRMVHHARMKGIRTLVTTEKDVMNLPKNTELALDELDLVFLAIEVKLENEALFFDLLENAVPALHPDWSGKPR